MEERQKGVPNPQQAVLSTATINAIPHARVVSIREISDFGLIFFTQKETRKVSELHENPFATLTFWFEYFERQVIVEGKTQSLSDSEIKDCWHANSREAQIRFYSYSPNSSKFITNKQEIEGRKKKVEDMYEGLSIPLSPLYCGFRLMPDRILFYDCSSDNLSEVFDYQRINEKWQKQLLAPYATRRMVDK